MRIWILAVLALLAMAPAQAQEADPKGHVSVSLSAIEEEPMVDCAECLHLEWQWVVLVRYKFNVETGLVATKEGYHLCFTDLEEARAVMARHYEIFHEPTILLSRRFHRADFPQVLTLYENEVKQHAKN